MLCFTVILEVDTNLDQTLAMPDMPAGRDCIIDIVGVFVRVSTETNRVDRLRQTRRDRQTEVRLRPVNISSRLREQVAAEPVGC